MNHNWNLYLYVLYVIGNFDWNTTGNCLDCHRVLVGRLDHMQGDGLPQDLWLLHLRQHPHGHLHWQIQCHGFPHLTQVILSSHKDAPVCCLVHGWRMLHSAVNRLQPWVSSHHSLIQTVYQHNHIYKQEPGACLLSLLFHTFMVASYLCHDLLLCLHHNHNIQKKRLSTAQQSHFKNEKYASQEHRW